MFFRRKTPKESPPYPCSICRSPATLTNGSPVPPGLLRVNEHSAPNAAVPHDIYFCRACLEELCGYIMFSIEECEKQEKDKELMERLATLEVGTVLTVIEEKPHALPNEHMKQLLENTPFSGIWQQEI